MITTESFIIYILLLPVALPSVPLVQAWSRKTLMSKRLNLQYVIFQHNCSKSGKKAGAGGVGARAPSLGPLSQSIKA